MPLPSNGPLSPDNLNAVNLGHIEEQGGEGKKAAVLLVSP